MASLYRMGSSNPAERLNLGVAPMATPMAAPAAAPAKANYEDYLAKVVKTIPTEVVSIYLYWARRSDRTTKCGGR